MAMSAATNSIREYELVLMLDPEIPDERRDQIASAARSRIESGATLKHDTAWGMRKLAYEIRQRTEADYRFYRFEGGGEILDDLNHELRIADGVLRFRIFKVDPRSPAIVPPAPLSTAAGARPSRRPSREEAAPTPAAPQAEAQEPVEAAADEPSAPAPEEESVQQPEEPTPAGEAEEAPADEAESSG
jgi:small subunit ribosomal protein S6